MRSVTLDGAHPRAGWLARRLRLAVSAIALAFVLGAPRVRALDLDATDGINTETIASRERQTEWDPARRQGVQSVKETDRAFGKPDGIRSGNYLIFPEAGAAVVFDDNIFSHDIDKVSDVRSELTGGVKMQSQLPRHVLDFSLDGKVVNYLENSEQDYANVRARLDGALHFDHAHTLSASVMSAIEHEERNDPSVPLSRQAVTAEGPIQVFHNRAAVGITRDVGRLYGTVAATVESWDFSDVAAIDGRPLDQDARDLVRASSMVKFGYHFSPGYQFVGKLRAYGDENRGNLEFDGDAFGYEAMAGLAFETNPLLRWRILGGYGVRDYEQSGIASLATTLLEADVQWLPTQRLTIYATLARQIVESADIAASGVVQSAARIRAEYEIYHNLILTGGVELREDEFSGVDRSDTIYAARAGLEYLYTKNWLFTFGYEHQVRDSSIDSLDMHRNRFMFGAKLRF